MNETVKIGEILVSQGILSEQQVFEILQKQKDTGVPFGVLAENMFDVCAQTIEEAWIEQYHRFTGEIDLDHQIVDDKALRLINRRQAWQFEILPLRFEPSGELLIAASKNRLARAVSFIASKIKPVVYFRIARSDQLRYFLQKHYPMPEVSKELIEKARSMAG